MKNKFLILLYIFTFTFAIKGYTTECGNIVLITTGF